MMVQHLADHEERLLQVDNPLDTTNYSIEDKPIVAKLNALE